MPTTDRPIRRGLAARLRYRRRWVKYLPDMPAPPAGSYWSLRKQHLMVMPRIPWLGQTAISVDSGDHRSIVESAELHLHVIEHFPNFI